MKIILSLIKNKLNKLINHIINLKDVQKPVCEYLNELILKNIKQLFNIDDIIETSLDNIILNFNGNNKLYKIVVKTQNIDKPLSFPNLISIDKARKILENKNSYIIFIFIKYKIKKDSIKIVNVVVKPIESLNWDYIGIQNVGKGQLYIKNTNKWNFFKKSNRKNWLDNLVKLGAEHYENLMLKVFEYKTNWINNENELPLN